MYLGQALAQQQPSPRPSPVNGRLGWYDLPGEVRERYHQRDLREAVRTGAVLTVTVDDSLRRSQRTDRWTLEAGRWQPRFGVAEREVSRGD